MNYLNEAEKTRLNELRAKDNRTDAEDDEFEALEDKDKREEVPSGTTTPHQQADVDQNKAPR